MKFVILATLVAVFAAFCYAKQECLTVRGRAKCSANTPIFIKLVDEDGTSGDDPMDETYAGKTSGSFQLWGCASDPIGHIDPELHLYHNCKGEERRVKLIIPEAAIGKEYNYTEVINLDGVFQNDEKKKSPAKKCTVATKKPKFYFF